MNWTKAEDKTLTRLATNSDKFLSEIAEILGKKPQAVRYRARTLGLKASSASRRRIGQWNTKHAHLREKCLRYFLTHTFEETREHFGLTDSEMKSLFTVAYRDPRLAHLRKDTRRKDEWTHEETLFLIRHAGIRERNWIGKRLNRGGQRNIKERMQKWNAATKYLNGMPKAWASELWGPGVGANRFIQTKAGPTANSGSFRFRIIPWHDALRISKTRETPVEVKASIRAMAKFQEFIFQTKSAAKIRREIVRCLEAK